MIQSQRWKGIELDTPGTYRIRVQGKLDERWFDRLDNMSITSDTRADELSVTILVGHMPDKATLSGVLNALYDLRLPLFYKTNLK